MKAIRADYPTDWPHANVYTLADLHIGDAHCNEAEVLDRVQAIADDPYGLCVCNGDPCYPLGCQAQAGNRDHVKER